MRTTIDLPDPLFRELKSVAAHRGTTLKDIITAAIELELQHIQHKRVGKVQFPILPSKQPGSLTLTNADVEDLLT